MKKLIKLNLFLVLFFLFLPLCPTQAEIAGSDITKINIPGLELTDIQTLKTTEIDGKVVKTEIAIPWISEYIVGLYKYSLIFGSVLATLAIVIGGFLYAMSAGNPSRIQEAKSLMIGAVSGIIIILSAYTFLNIINPNLTNLKAIQLNIIQGIELNDTEEIADCNKFSNNPIDTNDAMTLLATIGGSSNQYLQKPAATKFTNWMRSLSFSPPTINSSYRSSERQACLHETLPKGQAGSACKITKAGHYGHQVALSVDLSVTKLTTEQYKELISKGLENNFENFLYKSADAVDDNWQNKMERWHFDYKGNDVNGGINTLYQLNPSCTCLLSSTNGIVCNYDNSASEVGNVVKSFCYDGKCIPETKVGKPGESCGNDGGTCMQAVNLTCPSGYSLDLGGRDCAYGLKCCTTR